MHDPTREGSEGRPPVRGWLQEPASGPPVLAWTGNQGWVLVVWADPLPGRGCYRAPVSVRPAPAWNGGLWEIPVVSVGPPREPAYDPAWATGLQVRGCTGIDPWTTKERLLGLTDWILPSKESVSAGVLTRGD